MAEFQLDPGSLTLKEVHELLASKASLTLSKEALAKIQTSCKVLKELVATHKPIYGVNTGFGRLANVKVEDKDLATLQERLILSHSAGVGEDLSDSIVALILLLKINSLAQGYSATRLEVIESLLKLYNAKYYPCIPSKGSVGASGDLAPLAHCSAVLMGKGHCRFEGEKIPAKQVLQKLKIDIMPFEPKEGLALLNGTQASTAIALEALFKTQTLFETALIAGAMSLDAACGSDNPFDPRLHQIRKQPSQIEVAKLLKALIAGSEIRHSHAECDRVQDPYSLRCQPQVMGACLNQINHAAQTLEQEINAVTDNPLVFVDTKEILSGGNFHAEPVAFACDGLALALSEIGSLSERRMALLIDQNLSGLPPFLIEGSGLNSGFMIAQVTAAALVTENKHLASPVSVDSLPTSANQEDHVSMATYAARRLHTMIENLSYILAIELMAACQGIDFRKPLKTSSKLQIAYDKVRLSVPFFREDQELSHYIETIQKVIMKKTFTLINLI